MDHWRSYLQHAEFIIRTDHRSLAYLDNQRLSTPWQQKALTKLLGLHYRISYNKGLENGAADALSRQIPDEIVEVSALSVSIPAWLQDVPASYVNDPHTQRVLHSLTTNGKHHTNFELQSGVLYFKSRIWIGNNDSLQQQILANLHTAAIGGHSGTLVTYHRVKQLFAWPGLRQSVNKFVQSCDICQRAKVEHVKLPGLLQPLEIPDHAWQVISLDFIEGLPLSASCNVILVIVDKFSKFAHFLALRHPYTALTVVQLFMSEVHCIHGLPRAIISDRDRVFTSQLWKELFRRAGTQLRMSSSYHPQSDGQTERVNQCLEMFLRCFTHACPAQWQQWLGLAQFWYNSSYHSALAMSPFEAMFGRKPAYFGLSIASVGAPDQLNSWLDDRNNMNSLIHHHLLRAQQRMKYQADAHRSERSFCVGDWVFMKLQPYVQQSVMTRANKKLSFKFYGPFQIVQRIDSVAYKLDLPATSLIHPVVHVSQLKKAIAPAEQVQPVLPTLHPVAGQLAVPGKILQRRLQRRGNKMVVQVLVEWSGVSSPATTWENLEELRHRFPVAPAWGQADFQDGWNVTPRESGAEQSVELNGPSSETRPKRMRRANPRVSGEDWTQ